VSGHVDSGQELRLSQARQAQKSALLSLTYLGHPRLDGVMDTWPQHVAQGSHGADVQMRSVVRHGFPSRL